MEIFVSSVNSLIRETIFLRTSVDNGGMLIRTTRPSLCGLNPKSRATIAFSISLIVFVS